MANRKGIVTHKPKKRKKYPCMKHGKAVKGKSNAKRGKGQPTDPYMLQS